MISVCIATYNGEKYIKDQLDSILVQLHPDDEVIISDDSSTDKTIEIIKSYNDKRIVIYENQKFRSPIFNFENSLMHASGDYIFLSDQDDIWVPNKIEIMRKFLANFDLVVSDTDIIDANGNIQKKSFYRMNGSRKGLIENLGRNSYLGCTLAFNQKILQKSLPFPKDTPMHDWWIGLIAEIYGKTYFIDEKLIYYRKHGANASVAGETSHYFFGKKILFRVSLIKNLILRYFKCKR